MPSPKFQAVRGCRDILPSSARLRQALYSSFRHAAELRCCSFVETPILESASLFRSLGEQSDVNTHQTFRLSTSSSSSLNEDKTDIVLRPEGTAGIARLYSSSLASVTSAHTKRLWYAGPMFRHERPQAGRLRQFTQFGVEYLSTSNHHQQVHDDIDLIHFAITFLHHDLNLDIQLRLNTVGSLKERHEFNSKLYEYFKKRESDLSDQGRKRLNHVSKNCIRILDDGRERKQVLEEAPKLHDFVDEKEHVRLEQIQTALQNDFQGKQNISIVRDHTLVRGLDYYQGVAFELDSTFNGWTLGGGGRYTDVANSVNGVGFALGLERIEQVLEKSSSSLLSSIQQHPDWISVIALDIEQEEKEEELKHGKKGQDKGQVEIARQLVNELRKCGDNNGGIPTLLTIEKNAKRTQKIIARAAQMKCAAIVVIGDREVQQNVANVKMIVDDNEDDQIGEQQQHNVPVAVPLSEVPQYIVQIMQERERERKQMYKRRFQMYF